MRFCVGDYRPKRGEGETTMFSKLGALRRFLTPGLLVACVAIGVALSASAKPGKDKGSDKQGGDEAPAPTPTATEIPPVVEVQEAVALDVGGTVASNPLPAAVLLGGLGGLIVAGLRRRAR